MSSDTPPDPNLEQEEALLRGALPVEIQGRLRSARLKEGRAIVVAEAGDLGAKAREELEGLIEQALIALPQVEEARVALITDRRKRMIIAVGSGKGGVGKSTLTTNLAVALAKMGRKVGVIDGDIYGPSQARLLATEKSKAEADGEKLVPIESPHGVKMLSMGNLVAQGKALAWRGPMAGKALNQIVDAAWGDTELLLIDLPPGTGDVQISMLSDNKPDGAVLVSTPQDLALMDAARAGQLFEDGDVPIIGLVENMSGYCCPECGHISNPFGEGGVEKFASALEIPFLGKIPLTMETRLAGDAGKPPALGGDDGAQPFIEVARALDRWIANGKV